MKKIILIMVSLIFMMGCSLDQELQQENNDPPLYPCNAGSEETIYIDCDGNIITDPEIIAKIKDEL